MDQNTQTIGYVFISDELIGGAIGILAISMITISLLRLWVGI
jgi:hypothetical protein